MIFNQTLTRVSVVFALLAAAVVSVPARADQDADSDKEMELLAVLRSDATESEKAITCKQLAIHGSSAAVSDLAKLLPNPRLSSWARIALEAIPGAASDEALRNAIGSLEGELLIGTINSIGVRQDPAAVDSLTTLLKSDDTEVAAAAAVALGRIGNEVATQSLRTELAAPREKVRSAVAEGCVLCAERLYNSGEFDKAVELYDEVRNADVPKPRIIEATRGAILARNQEGVPLLLELLNSPDKELFQLGLSTAREFPGDEIDQVLADHLEGTTPERAALIVLAMADRPNTVELSAVLKAAGQGPKQLRVAAMSALGDIGDASCLATLLDAATGTDQDLADSAKEALVRLSSEGVNEKIVSSLANTQAKSYPVVIELVGRRRIEAVPELLKALDDSDAGVRTAALTSLGETIALDRLSVLISRASTPKYPQDSQVARQALRAASVRMPDRDACAEQLADALVRAPADNKIALLEILSEVGGTKALQTLAMAAKSSDTQLQDAGSRLLGKWNGVEAAPVLLDLAKTAPSTKYQIRALRGYIGIARKFDMPESQRVEMCQKALDTANRIDEKKLVLDVLQIHPSRESMKLAVKALQIPELGAEAKQASLVIAQRIPASPAVSELLSKAGIEKVKLEILKAEYGAGSTQKGRDDRAT